MEEKILLPDDIIKTIDKYNSLIEEAKGMLFTSLGYEKSGELFYNKAYFNAGQNITKEYIDSQVDDGDTLIQNLDELHVQVEEEPILNDAQKKVITSFIKRTILETRYHQHAIYIEAEKGGYPLSNAERILHRKEVLKLEDTLYGKDITQLGKRTDGIVTKFHQLYLQNQNELTGEEKKIWEEKILNKFQTTTKIETKAEIVPVKNIYIDEAHIFDMVALVLEIEGFKAENIIKINIGPKKTKDDANKDIPDITEPIEENGIYYVPLARKDKEIYEYFNSKDMGQKFKIIKKNIGNSSIDISKENNKFKKNHFNLAPPEKNGKYNITTKVLPIIYEHEVSTHVNTGIGNYNNIYIRDPERSDLEEGIAGFNQKMAENKDIQEMYETGIGDIGMFLGEHFDGRETKELLDIYFKLTKEKNQNTDDRARKIKMGVPLGEKGSRRKDLTYGNGKEIIRELEELTKTPEGIETLNTYARAIYSTKLGYESIKDVNNILGGIKNLAELEPNFPIFAGKIIYWKLFKGKLDKDKMLENDLRRFIKTNKNVSNEQKRLLVKIMQLIRKHGETQSQYSTLK